MQNQDKDKLSRNEQEIDRRRFLSCVINWSRCEKRARRNLIMAEGGAEGIEQITEQPSSRTKERNRTLDWVGVDLENLRKLKQVRGCKKGVVTKAQNEIRELMENNSSVALVKDKLDQLNRLFEDFTRAHAAYHDQLEDECDIDESNEYFKAMEQANVLLAGTITRWIITPKASGLGLPLEDNLSEVIDDVTPADSISNAGTSAGSKHSCCSISRSVLSKGSAASSVSSARVKAAARRAILEAEATNLDKLQAIQREELALQMRKKAVELQTEIAKAQAEELVYAQAEANYEGTLPEPDNTGRAGVQKHRQVVDTALSLNVQTPGIGAQADTPNRVPMETKPPDPEVMAKGLPKCNRTPAKPYLVHSEMKTEVDKDVSVARRVEPTSTESLAQRLLEAQFLQNQQFQALIRQQQESTLALTLPQPNVPIFSGNPIDYWTFIRAFENLIEHKTASESARLYYLVQYTTGEVQDLVKSCLTMREEVGYREARNLLQKRYGSSYRIASAYVDKLTREPPIKSEDGDALRKFSIELTGCKNTLQEIGYLNKLENPDTLKTIVQRLPYGLRQKWRDVADNITENQEREITIADLSDFVTAKARAATHAIFGDISSQVPQPQGGSREKPKFPFRSTSSFSTQADPEHTCNDVRKQQNQAELKCPLCCSNHWLSQCDGFKGKSLADRWQFVNSRMLCVN